MKNLIENVVSTAIEAGEKILTYYDNSDFKLKDDESPLTQADIEANKIIESRLKSFSNYNILSEEGSKVSWETRRKWQSYWIVDPLDGTKEFLKKNDEFTVNIALIEKNIPKLGVIYIPALKTLYYGQKGYGSFKHVFKNDNKKINFFNDTNRIFCKSEIKDLKFVASRSHPSKELDNWLSNFGKYQLTDAGSSLKFCLVAEGVADAYPRFVGSSEWDIAAGYIILLEANGCISDEFTNEIKFNKESIRNPNFIASSKVFFEKYNQKL